MFLFPGLGLVLLLTLITRVIHSAFPIALQKSISEVLIGIALGLIVNFFFANKLWRKKSQLGIKFCFDFLLKTAIVFLGLNISLNTFKNIGGEIIIVVILLIIFAIVLSAFLGKLFNIPPKLASLIGIGAAVCGNTAISATAPAIKADDKHMSFALATNTLFGTMAVFLYPLLADYLHLSHNFFGLWTGLAVNDTSQVVATGFAYSDKAGEMATTVKLVRNSLMGFVIIAMTVLYQAKPTTPTPFYKRIKIPTFVFLFVVVALFNSFGAFQNFTLIIESINKMTKLFILMALIGVGLNTNLKELKQIGPRPLLVGLICSVFISLTSFGILKYLLN